MFDTLSYAKKLEAAGVSREQAETHIRILAEVVEGSLVTKTDLDNAITGVKADVESFKLEVRREFAAVRDDMQKLEYRMTIKLGTIVTIAIAATATVFKMMS